MKKRILALLLAAVMVMAMVPSVFAAEATGTCGENLTWAKSADGTLTISGTGDMTNYNMTTTGALVNLKSLAGEFTSVVVESGVTSIGDDAFSYCDTLESVTIGDTVTRIGIHAFANCEALERVDLPASLTEVGLMAFDQCNALSDVYYAGTREQWNSISIGDGNEPLTQATIHFAGEAPAKNQIGDHITWALSGGTLTLTGTGEIPFFNSSIESITGSFTTAVIGSGITRIGNSTFFNCNELTTVTIPATVTAIDDLAFTGCTALTDVYFGGTEAQWAAITVGSSNEPLTKAAVHYNATSFTDVPANAWYAAEVEYAVEHGLMQGIPGGKFDPDGIFTQGQILTLLARRAGVDTRGCDPWYQAGVEWAKEKGVSDGEKPEETITRAELATLLYRCADSPAVSTSQMNKWPDASSIPDSEAVSAMAWCVENGIINGTGDGKLLPLGTATRKEVAVMIQRYCEKLA